MNICQTLPPSLGSAVVHKLPLRLVGGGLPQMPLEPTREQQGAWLCVNSPHDLERVKGAFDINAFKRGGLGATPR